MAPSSLATGRNRNKLHQTWQYEPLADRIWLLSSSIVSDDAAHVALAELPAR